MTEPQTITLDPAAPSEAPLLSNMLELYIHDLSEAFGNVELGADARFGYPKLPLYFSEPEQRFPFLIRCDTKLAGFVFVTRGSPASDDPGVLDVAEFFVLRSYRRSAVGRRAACLVWHALPGSWTVRVSERNLGGLAFWRDVIAEFSHGTATESSLISPSSAWRVFSFQCGR